MPLPSPCFRPSGSAPPSSGGGAPSSQRYTGGASAGRSGGAVANLEPDGQRQLGGNFNEEVLVDSIRHTCFAAHRPGPRS